MLMMIKRIFSGVMICISMVCFSQSKPAGSSTATPNAVGSGLYGEMPVSYFTGLPNIEVPVYTIHERGLNFPITMSYHAQGFRPDVHPSWVGANWSLNFGGVITRKMNNLPDEWKSDEYSIYGYYYARDRLNNSNWSSTDTLSAMSAAIAYYQKKIDREPDEFSFNFLGFSGKFYLDHLGKWRVQSNKNLRVICDEADQINPFFHNSVPVSSFPNFKPKVFGKFTLIDDAGIKYVFGNNGSTDGIEYSSSITPPDFNYRLWLIGTSWHLVEVKFPDATGIINITYQRGPFQSNFQYFESQNRFWISRCDPGGPANNSNYDAKGLSGNITSPVYPTDITTTSGTKIILKFSKSNELAYPSSTYLEVFRDEYGRLPSQQSPPTGIPLEYFNFMQARNEVPYYVANNIWADGVIDNSKFIWFKLDSLIVSNWDHNNNLTNFPFRKLFFNYRENANERLKLLSLNFKGTQSAGESHDYSFVYNDWGAAAPGYVTNLTDHWGFANDKTLKRDPGYGGYEWFGGNMLTNREPDEIKTKVDVLTEIIYHTGGKTSFEYESNDYSRYLPINTRNLTPSGYGKAGGLRIKKITTADGFGNTSTREFFYVTGYNPTVPLSTLSSSGILDGKPASTNYNYLINYSGLAFSLYSSNSIVPLSSNSGAICGYSEVAEKFKDGSYKVYKFTNHDNGYGDHDAINNVTPYELGVPYRSRSFERGQLLSEELFTSGNKSVQKTEHTYVRIGAGADSNFVRSLRKEFGGYCMTVTLLNPYIGQTSLGFQVPMINWFYIEPESFNPTYTTATAYGYYTYKFLPEKTTTRIYPSGNLLNQVLVAEVTNEYDQFGNLIKTTGVDSKGSVIANNFKYPYQFAGTSVYDEMINRNMTGYIVESNRYNGTTFLESEKTDYDFFNSSTLIKPRYIKKQIGSNSAFITTQFNQYDDKGNVLEIQSNDGVKTSYVWSYFKSRPVAKVVGSDYASIQPLINPQILSYPSQGEQQLIAEVDQLRTLLPNSFVSTYLYDSKSDWGLKQSKDPNGQSTFYGYDEMGRIELVRDNTSNILSKHEYKYMQEFSYPFKNTMQTRFITPTISCNAGYVANGGDYIVPANKYGSFVDQNDANQKAIAEIDNLGQAWINSVAVCIPYYQFTPCCNWGSVYSSFALTGTGSVNFSLTLTMNTGASSYGQVGTLSGILFLPSSNQNINFTSGGGSGTLVIYPSGQVNIMGSNLPTQVQISGTYTL